MASVATCFAVTARTRLASHRAFSVKPSLSKTLHFQSPSLQTSVLLRNACKYQSPRVVLPVVRASIDIPAGIKPGNVVETDKLPSDVRNRAMEAVDSFGGRVTIGDVASKAGLKLNEAQKALQALAADTGGFLEVSDEGDVLYVFPRDYRSKLAAKSFRMRIEPVLEKAKSAAEYLIRVSFGTALVASIVLVYTTIIALLSSRSEEDSRGRRGTRSYDSGFTFFFGPSDLFWYWDPYYYRRRRIRTDEDGMNFIESVFSFVFGDGDPNQGIEEERWKLIGQYIASNGGVVTAEELAPYLDVLPTDEMNDESYILPVLLRFDGQPEVDEEGNILYRFPSLQRTASSQRSGKKEYVGKRWADWVGGVEKFFKEKIWRFSNTGTSERAMVIGLGGLNLFGVIILGTMLKNTAVTQSGFISFVTNIFPLLQIYAASFFAIPLFRWFLLRKTNAEIEKRNQAREQRARALEVPDLSLRRKLLSARDMAQRTVIGPDRIVYSTDKDFYEQDYEAREWDRRFRELEKWD
ncbi:PREDICTED: uncharacterized protein At5g03900, chloroplastic [Nelumbo nucifera]|uniref:Iron-sulfur cluster biosynthesis family protein n=2 Tax=Nelumbo nucifera TaxID=4432 RepID=A0A822ZYD1_NELNU|nr:PREDICTED: uncharacterized protein At5g03900, chloroplastic [Nelumbo nucifera]DAD48541.1 TPA_asm: hypothetical protein HUJ06_018478 [Nelumbo nucifera]